MAFCLSEVKFANRALESTALREMRTVELIAQGQIDAIEKEFRIHSEALEAIYERCRIDFCRCYIEFSADSKKWRELEKTYEVYAANLSPFVAIFSSLEHALLPAWLITKAEVGRLHQLIYQAKLKLESDLLAKQSMIFEQIIKLLEKSGDDAQIFATKSNLIAVKAKIEFQTWYQSFQNLRDSIMLEVGCKEKFIACVQADHQFFTDSDVTEYRIFGDFDPEMTGKFIPAFREIIGQIMGMVEDFLTLRKPTTLSSFYQNNSIAKEKMAWAKLIKQFAASLFDPDSPSNTWSPIQKFWSLLCLISQSGNANNNRAVVESQGSLFQALILNAMLKLTQLKKLLPEVVHVYDPAKLASFADINIKDLSEMMPCKPLLASPAPIKAVMSIHFTPHGPGLFSTSAGENII